MDEVELKDKDYEKIVDFTNQNFRGYSMKSGESAVLCKCYVQAILAFTNSNKLVIQDGRIYKKQPVS